MRTLIVHPISAPRILGNSFSIYPLKIDGILLTVSVFRSGHNSGFEAIQPNKGLDRPSTLLNGIGNITRYSGIPAELDIRPPHTMHFNGTLVTEVNGITILARPRRYLIRIINTSFTSSFVFSIDNHEFQIVEADFVPVSPYPTQTIMVGIGQRYNVVVEAKPIATNRSLPDDGLYWIRAWEASCSGTLRGKRSVDYSKIGIVSYLGASGFPNTTSWLQDDGTILKPACKDEKWDKLKPIVEWSVGPPANDKEHGIGENLTITRGGYDTIYPLAQWKIGDWPLYVDYSNPSFLKLNYTGPYDALSVMQVENYNATDWVSRYICATNI